MYTPERRQPSSAHRVDVVNATLVVEDEPLHTYETPAKARVAANTYARLASVGCSPKVNAEGVVTATPTTEQREKLRDARMLHR